MVSSSLGIPLDELIARLKRFAIEYADDQEYADFRKALPAEFPF